MMVLSSMHAPRVVDCAQINHVLHEVMRHDVDDANVFVLRKGEISDQIFSKESTVSKSIKYSE